MTLQEALQQSRLTKYQVAKETGIAFSAISDIFSGKRSLESCSAKTVQLLSVLFGYSMEELLSMRNEGKHTSDEIVPIQTICDLCRPIFEKENIQNAYLFGSYARGEAQKESDIDIVIEPHHNLGTRILSLNSILESTLKKPVDLYTTDEIPFLMDSINKDKRLIYHERVH